MKEKFVLQERVVNGVIGSNSGKTEQIEDAIFELEKSGIQSKMDGSFETVRSAWRVAWDGFRYGDWVTRVEDPNRLAVRNAR